MDCDFGKKINYVLHVIRQNLSVCKVLTPAKLQIAFTSTLHI
jgi:hypothetical protein